MENHFEIVPYEGIFNPIFGMLRFHINPEEYLGVIGNNETRKQRTNKYGTQIISEKSFRVFFENQTILQEIEFFEEATLYYDGIDLFNDPLAVKKVLKLSNKPLEDYDSLLFLDLGFIMWGFHKEADGRTVCLFSRGYRDDQLSSFQPYKK